MLTQQARSRYQTLGYPLILAGLLIGLAGCGGSRQAAEAQASRSQARPETGPPAVEVAIARTGTLEETLEYTGTTQPFREVSLRSQLEGQLLSLPVDVGDRVQQGQILGQIDDALLTAEVVQAEAELAARQAEVAQAQNQVSEVQARVEQSRLELQQAEIDATRLEELVKQGAISAQEAETARTRARTTAQVLRSTQEQVRTQEQIVAAAHRRVLAQQAIVAQARERRSFATLTAPMAGIILERVSEPGNLLQPGNEVLRLGDFSQVKVAVQVSELELTNIRPGQTVAVRLDAFPNQPLEGTVNRISPAADPIARLVPIEVTLANPNGQIGSGLLVRVGFAPIAEPQVVVPATALASEAEPGARATLFVVTGTGEQAQVAARSVTLGDRRDGKVAIQSGLAPGESFVARMARPLKDGEPVRLSLLSESNRRGPQR